MRKAGVHHTHGPKQRLRAAPGEATRRGRRTAKGGSRTRGKGSHKKTGPGHKANFQDRSSDMLVKGIKHMKKKIHLSSESL